MVARALLAVACLILLVAHMTGSMRQLSDLLDIGIDPRHYIYLAALPGACLCGLLMLRN
jgi:TRAP-type C4-dicarboxylate transport system permease small subunit